MSSPSSDFNLRFVPMEVGPRTTCTQDVMVVESVHNMKAAMLEQRRWFHKHPELSFQEVKTAAKVVEILRTYGITEIHEQIGKTGVVALIRGSAPGPCIALRADMDALPIGEAPNDTGYCSVNEGVMHACGHDGHMTSLLTAAKHIHDNRESLRGVVKLVFQPAEEGYAGAMEMIKDGVLEDGRLGPKVDAIYGIHLWSYDKLGSVGCQEGPIMAGSDRFEIKVKGVGGHGAVPQGTVDAIVEAAHVVTQLHTIVSRNVDPLDSGVVTCGMINGGYAYNIIADDVTIIGTCRSFTKSTQELIKSRMQCVCCGVENSFGGKVDLNYKYGYPPTINSYPECVKVVQEAASKVVGVEHSKGPQRTMGAEDFSFFLEERPGCFFFVGASLPGDQRPHHKAVFDFDENAMLISASVLVQIVYDLMVKA